MRAMEIQLPSTFPSYHIRRRCFYFLHDINDYFQHHHGSNFAVHQYLATLQAHDAHMQHLSISHQDVVDRPLRQKLVEYAKMIWGGQDPFPDIVKIDPDDQEHSTRPRHHIANDPYRRWRETWAPTEKLSEFLFPKFLLANDPLSVSYDGKTHDKEWLDLPACFHRGSDTGAIQERDLCDAAEHMLRRLILFEDDGHVMLKRGMQVSTWVAAAESYHARRLEKELQSGATVHFDFPVDVAPFRFRVRALRVKLDLQRPGEDEMLLVPGRVTLQEGSRIFPTIEVHIRHDQFAIQARQSYRRKLAEFNKILLGSCFTCPRTGSHFSPFGVDGLIKHIRVHYPMIFWSHEEEFHIVG